MKVLITGASGLLGTDVWKTFEPHHELVAIGRHRPAHIPLKQWMDCDLKAATATYTAVTRENPDLVIHCAAYNDVDRAQSHPEEAYQVNAIGTRNLALACQRFDTVLLAVSSDYVFNGHAAPESGYREFDPPQPLSAYAQSKRWGEIFVEQLLNKFYIVRTSWLFGEARPTFPDQVAQWAMKNQPIPCVKDMVSAPTYTPDLAQALRQLAESRCYGTYHLTNQGFCSRVEWAQEVLRIHHIDKAVLKIMTQAEFKRPAPRPPFSGLDNLAWRLQGFSPLRPWQEALRAHFSASKIPSL